MRNNTIVLGSQWGDEGKGKVIDYLAEEADVIVRSQGGSNAGHTVQANGKKYTLHLVPSGILWKGKINIIGNGVVVNPIKLKEEIEYLLDLGVRVLGCSDTIEQNLFISNRAHIVHEGHIIRDARSEAELGENMIGTTKQGIGPAYSDKACRIGLRLCDFDAADASVYNRSCAKLRSVLPDERSFNETIDAICYLSNFVCDTVELTARLRKEGKSFLFEGAQGVMLDVDFGTYPYVTSSSTSAGGVCSGSGVPPTDIDTIIGVCKAYTTRVGSGPFVTEDENLSGYIHNVLGREFGATTGRPRRCGWADACCLRYSSAINGFSYLVMTNLDGLDHLDWVKICTHYKKDYCQTFDYPPALLDEWYRCKPVYDTLQGWKTDTTKCTSWEELPEKCKAFVRAFEKSIGTPIGYVGVGPNREQLIKVPLVD